MGASWAQSLGPRLQPSGPQATASVSPPPPTPGPRAAYLRPIATAQAGSPEVPPQAVVSCPSRMVKGLPQKLFLGQDYRSPLSAKVFSSWDFCIRGQEAATIKQHEISNEFKVSEGVRVMSV